MLSQMLWGDAVYVRDLFELRDYSQAQLLSAAMVLHEVYHSYDIVAHILQVYDSRAGVASDLPSTSGSTESRAEGELSAVRAEIEELKAELHPPGNENTKDSAARNEGPVRPRPQPLHKAYMAALGVPPS